MKVGLEQLETPHPNDWEGPYFMLWLRTDPEEVVAINGWFPVFRSRRDAEMLVEAMKESQPKFVIDIQQVPWGIAAASELKFGKPSRLVRARRVT